MERYTEEKLNKMSVHTLRVILRSEFGGVPGVCNKSELINQILDIQAGASAPARSTKGRKPLGEFITPISEEISFSDVDEDENCIKKGVFEINADGYGFVRVNKGAELVDFFVPKTIVKKYDLRTGDELECSVHYASEMGSLFVNSISTINGKMPEVKEPREQFSQLKSKYPNQKITFKKGMFANVDAVDAFCPIGKGQRCIVEDPSAKHGTEFVNSLINCANEDGLKIITLFAGAKPEALEEYSPALHSHYVALPINLGVEEILRAVNLTIERAKTMCLLGNDVLLVIDNLSYIASTYADYCMSEKASGYVKMGLSPNKYVSEIFSIGGNFGANKSLTVVATVDSKRDPRLFEELASVATSVIKLKSSDVVSRRGFVVDLNNSYTDKDELLLEESQVCKVDEDREKLTKDPEYLSEIYKSFK